MRKKLLPILLSCLLILVCFPYQLIALKTSEKHFIEKMLSNAAVVNSQILQSRRRLLKAYHHYQSHIALSSDTQSFLHTLAAKYKVKKPNFKDESTWQTLIRRVDIVPNALVVAQAINESAWGRSRFAKEGNNYFGQWCYTKGCGIVPNQRASGRSFEVRKFPSVLSSVKSYMLNLNSNHLYRQFRIRRHTLRLAGEPITSLNLVPALSMYSIKREQYVKLISNIIERYHLSTYDLVANTMKPKKSEFHWF